MKRFLSAMLVLALVLGFVVSTTLVSCGGDDEDGGGLYGTFYSENGRGRESITFNSNGTFSGTNSSRTVTGTYTVRGDAITLSISFYGTAWYFSGYGGGGEVTSLHCWTADTFWSKRS
jgi:hypothetical protein